MGMLPQREQTTDRSVQATSSRSDVYDCSPKEFRELRRMPDPHAEIETAIQEASRTHKAISSKRSKQVSASEEVGLLKATAFAWLRQHRKSIATCVGQEGVD